MEVTKTTDNAEVEIRMLLFIIKIKKFTMSDIPQINDENNLCLAIHFFFMANLLSKLAS